MVEDLRRAAHDVQHRRLLAQLALQVARQQARQVLPAIQLVGQPHQLLQAEALGRRLLEHLAVPAQRAVVVFQLLLVEARDPLGPREPLRRLLDLQQANLADLDQRGPVGAARVHRLQQLGGLPPHRDVVEHPLQHRDRARVIGIAGQHQPQVFERRSRDRSADRARSAPCGTGGRPDRAPAATPPLQQILQQPRQIAPALGLRVQTIERLRRLAVAGARSPARVRTPRSPRRGAPAALSASAPICSAQPRSRLVSAPASSARRTRISYSASPSPDLAIDLLQRLQRVRRRRGRGRGRAGGTPPPSSRRPAASGRLGDRAIEAQLDRLVEHVGADLAVQRRHLGRAAPGRPAARSCRATRGSSGSASASRIARAVVARAASVSPRRVSSSDASRISCSSRAARVGLRLDVDTHHRRQLGVAAVDSRRSAPAPAPPPAAEPPSVPGARKRSSAASASGSAGAASSTSRQRPSASAGSPSGPSSSAAIWRSSADPFGASVRRRQRQPPLEDLQPVAVAPLLLVEPRQRLQRRIVLRVLVQDADARGDRLVDVADVAFEQARDPPPQLLARAPRRRPCRCACAASRRAGGDWSPPRRCRSSASIASRSCGSNSRIDRSVADRRVGVGQRLLFRSAMRNRIFLRVAPTCPPSAPACAGSSPGPATSPVSAYSASSAAAAGAIACRRRSDRG